MTRLLEKQYFQHRLASTRGLVDRYLALRLKGNRLKTAAMSDTPEPKCCRRGLESIAQPTGIPFTPRRAARQVSTGYALLILKACETQSLDAEPCLMILRSDSVRWLSAAVTAVL